MLAFLFDARLRDTPRLSTLPIPIQSFESANDCGFDSPW